MPTNDGGAKDTEQTYTDRMWDVARHRCRQLQQTEPALYARRPIRAAAPQLGRVSQRVLPADIRTRRRLHQRRRKRQH